MKIKLIWGRKLEIGRLIMRGRVDRVKKVNMGNEIEKMRLEEVWKKILKKMMFG